MSGGLAALNELKNFVPQSQLCNVYYALTESHLRYADVIWVDEDYSEVVDASMAGVRPKVSEVHHQG